ncbi:HIRAN domain-containing protein [Suttonella sp. R2A3]|uniref:HIRAN domain-containing protein n=1 Tax=Suttonella sp. R2A3 TaxID=2908648 RepID=UPI001F25F651|nr:HIRAN domain-containing protein [Suttonella sp. R2A3]UJF24799.1 HIRAN domain-containing protein [Suttonella sp. R2A3]
MLNTLLNWIRPHPKAVIERVPIAGLQYYRAHDIAQFMERGDALDLVVEPNNAHDPRAIMVYWQNNKIGYIPSEDANAVHTLFKRHKKLSAKITEIDPKSGEHRWVKLNIYPCSAAHCP